MAFCRQKVLWLINQFFCYPLCQTICSTFHFLTFWWHSANTLAVISIPSKLAIFSFSSGSTHNKRHTTKPIRFVCHLYFRGSYEIFSLLAREYDKIYRMFIQWVSKWLGVCERHNNCQYYNASRHTILEIVLLLLNDCGNKVFIASHMFMSSSSSLHLRGGV